MNKYLDDLEKAIKSKIMPVYKALILNKEININYEPDQKNKLVEAIKSIKIN